MSEFSEEVAARKVASRRPAVAGERAAHIQSPVARLHASLGNLRTSRALDSAQRSGASLPLQGATQSVLLRALDGAGLLQRDGDEEEELIAAKHDTSVQRQDGIDEEEELVSALHDEGHAAAPQLGLEGGPLGQDSANRIESARGGGSPLDSSVRERMETSFGADFSNVRIHQDTEADSLAQGMSARAFTTGSDVFLRTSEQASDTHLLAHELTHVVQQSPGSAIAQQSSMSVGAANDPLEAEADRAADLVNSGASARALLMAEERS